MEKLLDPFCGGGSIPLEAQRLGLEAHGSDLNPVAVLITKALIEIPPRFAGKPPVNPESRARMGGGHGWTGAKGLAEDVRYYGKWMRDEAQKRIGHLYPKVQLPKEQGGSEATVIAWLWSRTVICPNPACRARMPLVRSFILSAKKGNETWVEPIVDRAGKSVHFEVQTGHGAPPDGTLRNRSVYCLICNGVSALPYVRGEAQAGRMSSVPLAIVAEAHGARQYFPPSDEHARIARSAEPLWQPDEEVTTPSHDVDRLPMYGMFTWGDAFTLRQLVALTTFSNLVGEASEQVHRDAVAAGLLLGEPLAEGGLGARAYADAVTTYLAFAVDKMADTNSTLCTWQIAPPRLRATFGRQALSMTWDYAEANPFGDAAGDYRRCVGSVCEVLDRLVPSTTGKVCQQDASLTVDNDTLHVIATDPPYYDNIGYADLSDYFYVWLRRSLNTVYPDLFSTMLVPKAQELVAVAHRFGGNKDKARRFFEHGLGDAFSGMRVSQCPEYPLTVYYAFKQAEQEHDNEDRVSTASTGWESMLEGLIKAGLSVTGTWPMRSELTTRNIGRGTNALASSIVLVCRARPADAPRSSRRDFVTVLRRELPKALRELQHGNIAPVDLAQATIGPGMAIFSRYSQVMEAGGSAMRVRTALQLINQSLDEVLSEQEGEFDADTRWALAWFEQFGTGEGLYGVAETLSKAKNTSVAGLGEAGLLVARGGKVRLLRRDELPDDWDPAADTRLTVWEATQHLLRSLEQHGEQGAAALLAQLGDRGEVARDLAYRLYTVCERKGWADEALAYNSLVIAWPQITQLASQQAAEMPRQQELFT